MLGAFLAVFDAEKRILWESPDTWMTLENPIGFSWVPDFESSTLGGILFMATTAAGLIAIISLFARYRRSDHLARLQIRWLRAASLLFGVMILIGTVFGSAIDAGSQVGEGVYGVLFSMALLGIPVAALIAITRNHLYELDRVVSRTVLCSTRCDAGSHAQPNGGSTDCPMTLRRSRRLSAAGSGRRSRRPRSARR